MATIQGQFIDQTTAKPISDVVMDVYATSDGTIPPVTSFQSNSDGTFNISSSYLDNGEAWIDVQYPGYYQFSGVPSIFQGSILLTPNQVTKTIQSIPSWVWIVIVALALFIGYKYFLKGKKLF